MVSPSLPLISTVWVHLAHAYKWGLFSSLFLHLSSIFISELKKDSLKPLPYQTLAVTRQCPHCLIPEFSGKGGCVGGQGLRKTVMEKLEVKDVKFKENKTEVVRLKAIPFNSGEAG